MKAAQAIRLVHKAASFVKRRRPHLGQAPHLRSSIPPTQRHSRHTSILFSPLWMSGESIGRTRLQISFQDGPRHRNGGGAPTEFLAAEIHRLSSNPQVIEWIKLAWPVVSRPDNVDAKNTCVRDHANRRVSVSTSVDTAPPTEATGRRRLPRVRRTPDPHFIDHETSRGYLGSAKAT